MNYIMFLIAILLPSKVFAEEMHRLDELSDLTLKNRIILIRLNQDVLEHKKLFDKHYYEIKDRDIIWFILKDTGVVTNYPGALSKGFLVKTKKEYPLEHGQVLLIGKDGGIKDFDNKLLLGTLFKKIDAMPMRRHELESRNKSKN